MSEPILIDGAMGEGGGQVIRTSLALSMVTGRPLQLVAIRAGRRKPGLLRQHLTALRASAAICGARIEGDQLGSREVRFTPGPIVGGRHRFAIGSAGSTSLVLQTLLPALLYAPDASVITVEGGTHNSKSPTTDALASTFLPALRHFGSEAEVHLERHGFYPAGGGSVTLEVAPRAPSRRVVLVDRGPVQLHATVLVCNQPARTGQRTLDDLLRRLPTAEGRVETVPGPGPGHVVAVTARTTAHTETFTAFLEPRSKPARLLRALAEEVRTWLDSGAVVGEHTADQLLLPLALGNGGRFSTVAPTLHTQTNIAVVQRFLPVRFSVDDLQDGRWMITVEHEAPR
jgi:RNA 3'-terminal phosphate cyclase (ATP)